MRQITAPHPKAEPINVAEEGVYYGNHRFSLVFQRGPIDPHGNLNGVLEEEVLAAMEDRARLLGQEDLAAALATAGLYARDLRDPVSDDGTDVLLATETPAEAPAT